MNDTEIDELTNLIFNKDVQILNKYKEENERLNNELKLYKDNHEHLNNLLQQKENIIKEVREYIQDRYDGEALTHTFDKDNVKELLEILDEVDK